MLTPMRRGLQRDLLRNLLRDLLQAFSVWLRRHLRQLLAVALLAPVAGLLAFGLLDLLFPFPWQAVDRPPALEVLDRRGDPLRSFLPADGRWRFPVELEEVPDELVQAVVALEDRRFFHHPGVDPLAVLRAAASNLAAGRVVSGASTLPMQIARLAEPRKRTLEAKVVEAFRALQLELHSSKRELLALYFNLVPYGGNLEGVGAASRAYFGKRPNQLSLGELALLVTLPRSPNRFDPTRHPEAARGERDRVLARLEELGAISAEESAFARRQALPTSLLPMPFEAPHLTRRAAQGAAPGTLRVRTTLERRLQSLVEADLRQRMPELGAQGLGNVAAVVVELETRAVRAYVGSADFFDEAHEGQVDGAAARRSPGSALKPFLYALALDGGQILPDSFLLDVPRDYAGYVPENYDDRYRGRVTVRQALAESLNAPAVALLARVGLGRFHRLLVEGGLTTLDRPSGAYGLPLVLGAGEVTLLDLTNLYATLAEGGSHREVVWRLGEGEEVLPRSGHGRGRRLLSDWAAQQVGEMLTAVERPDLPQAWELARDVPAVAWKTGTSYGHRDAWAVGFSHRYAIGVWVGSFDGSPVKGISGAKHAGPLLFDLFRALEREGGPLYPPLPQRDEVEVCALSHELPHPFCPTRVKIPYLPGASRLSRCTYHRRRFIDREDGGLLAGECLEGRPRVAQVLALYPPELAAWWRSQGQPVPDLPPPSRHCRATDIVALEAPPRIVSPDAATPYRLRRDAPAQYQRLPLIARTGNDQGRLFWYQDGRLVASGPPGGEHYLPLEIGHHRLVVVDEAGRWDGVEYVVE